MLTQATSTRVPAGPAAQDRAENAPETIPVWDPFVRLFHWSLVALFVFCYISGDGLIDLHETAGYVIAALLGARVVWGFVGTRHARFADFVRGPRAVAGFLMATLRLRAPRHVGHNPAGGAMVLALIATITVICASGVMMGMDAFWGEQWVEDLHVYATWTAIGLVVLHVAGVILASIEHRENLVRAMFTGRKRP